MLANASVSKFNEAVEKTLGFAYARAEIQQSVHCMPRGSHWVLSGAILRKPNFAFDFAFQ
jgi:hypothetical protein